MVIVLEGKTLGKKNENDECTCFLIWEITRIMTNSNVVCRCYLVLAPKLKEDDKSHSLFFFTNEKKNEKMMMIAYSLLLFCTCFGFEKDDELHCYPLSQLKDDDE